MTSKQFLLVEDDDLVGDLLAFILEREGYAVIWAKDGQEAADVIDGDQVIDGALLDVMVPHVDGLQLLDRLRAHPRGAKVPVLMLTAKAQAQDIAQALERGADDYLVKPFQPAELTARLRRIMR